MGHSKKQVNPKSNYIWSLSDVGISEKCFKKNKAHWVLLSKNVCPGTRGRQFPEQEGIVKQKGYEVPHAIDVVASVFLHHLETGQCLFSQDHSGRLTYTRVVEKNIIGVQIIIGVSSPPSSVSSAMRTTMTVLAWPALGSHRPLETWPLAKVFGFCSLAFGTDASIAAFFVAFRLAHLLRRIFGEGTLQSAFIPHFENSVSKRISHRSMQLFIDLYFALSLILALLIGLAYGAYFLFDFGWNWPSGYNEIVNLSWLMFPSLLFICLAGLNTALLQCERSYFLLQYLL